MKNEIIELIISLSKFTAKTLSAFVKWIAYSLLFVVIMILIYGWVVG